MVNSFAENKEFGDKLEKQISIDFLKKKYPDHDIIDLPEQMHSNGLSPKKYGRDKKGRAIPDHAVVSRKTKEIVALYDSKNKKTLYRHAGHSERFWSTDEKIHDYRSYSKEYKVPCCAIFYNEEHDKDCLYIVNVNEQPKFYKKINNEHGEHWYGYYLSQTTPHPIAKLAKHNTNIREQDLAGVWEAQTLEESQDLAIAVLDRCEPEQSNKPMKPKKIVYFKFCILRAKTKEAVAAIIQDMYFAGEGMSLNNKQYNDTIKYA